MKEGRPAAFNDRYSRTRRVSELNHQSIMQSELCVVGAGALGNEVLKNIVLYGAKRLTIVDRDRVESSNLGRCFLFTSEDAAAGIMKVDAARRSLHAINDDVEIESRACDARELDGSFFRQFDAVVGCVDNIATRLHINSNCYFCSVPYIDGGLDGLRGRIQVVTPPDGACYQCSVNATHMSVAEREYTCTGREANVPRRIIAAEPSVSSITASMQTLELMKLLSGRGSRDVIIIYDGSRNMLETVAVEKEKGCDNHGGSMNENNEA